MIASRLWSKLFTVSFFPWLVLLSQFSSGLQSDIDCLRSIKESLQDPFNYLNSTWDFSNNTEGFICKFTGIDCWHSDENRVLNIRLADMGLRGQFPRGLENCTSLTGLNLSNNELTGPIPDDISAILTFVIALDLSSNSLSGPIPASLAECEYLNLLKLDNNKLTGVIPGAIANLNRLRTFSVANNLLHGPVPKFAAFSPFAGFPPESFANNAGLCGAAEKPCFGGYDDAEPMIAAPIAGVCVAAVGLGVGVLLYVRKRNKKIGCDDVGGKKSAKSLEEVNGSKVCMFDKSVSNIELNDLLKATDNFHEDNVIGRVGPLYKAILKDGTILMVERLQDSTAECCATEFISAATTLRGLKHPNLLPPLGFCTDAAREEKILVYEYMVNGNLYGNLHNRISQDDDEEDREAMAWPLRLKIAKLSAKALSWLRLNNFISSNDSHVLSQQPVISKRILLDAEFNPRIVLNLPAAAAAMDTNIDGDHVVVYSFGILLLELVTGDEEPPTTHPAASGPRAGRDFSMGKGLDYDVDEVSQVLEVACSCLADCPQERPATMAEVYQLLRGIGKPAGDGDEVIVMMPSDHGG